MKHNLKTVKNVLDGLWHYPLSKEKISYRLNVFLRFFKWQIVEKRRYTRGGIIKDWIGDRKLLVYPDRSCSTGNYYLGLMEYEEMGFLLHYIREEDCFVDCGANIGIYSILMGKKCEKGYAIEPSTDTFRILKKNMELNNLSNVKLIKAGVGEKPGKLFFSKGMDCVNHIVDVSNEDAKSNCEEIDVVTLDERFKDIDVNILKIDVEGFETKVLQGASQMLESEKLNVIIMEVFGKEKLINLLKEKGFSLCKYNPKERNLTLMQNDEAGNNGIFIRNVEKARDRIRKGDSIKIYGVTI